MHYFSNWFWYRTLHVSDRFTVRNISSLVLYTQQLVFVIQVIVTAC